MPNEAAKLLVSDYLEANGAVRVDSTVRAEIAFNGKPRPLVWANAKTCRAIDDYLAHRLVARHGATTIPAAYRGLDPHVLRGEDTEESDLDLLVEPQPGMSLLNVGIIRYKLADLLGVAVDVLTPNALPDNFRARVLAEAQPV